MRICWLGKRKFAGVSGLKLKLLQQIDGGVQLQGLPNDISLIPQCNSDSPCLFSILTLCYYSNLQHP